jgi:hypothetical protein
MLLLVLNISDRVESEEKILLDIFLYLSLPKRSYFDLSTKRFIVTDEEDKLLQQAYGDSDDFDDVVHLEYTINEEQLRERVCGHERL